MRQLIRISIGLFLVVAAFSACKKSDPYDAEKQLEIDKQLIKDFISDSIPAQQHESGIYYVIGNPGSGDAEYTASTVVTVKYSLRLLDGTVIPQSADSVDLEMGRVIAGFQIGVPLIQKGGKIRLLIPSGYAYGPNRNGPIPPNSVLDFNIELLDIKN